MAGGDPRLVSLSLNGLAVPDGLPDRRRYTAPPSRRTEAWLASYDRRTLVYDCWRNRDRGEAVMVAPRLLNLWPLFRDALRAGGTADAGRLRRRTHLRYEVLRLPVPPHTDALDFAFPDGSRARLPIGEDLHDAFAGTNALITKSKNNDLDWIADWARYHVHHHGAESVVFFDNASTDYATGDVARALLSVPGLRRVAVARAPYPFGRPGATGRFGVPAQFLQTALINIARLRFLGRARCATAIDVDELIRPVPGSSIFAEAESSRLGAVSFMGTWVYPADTPGAVAQRDHDSLSPARRPCGPKWCLRVDSWFGRRSWEVHRLSEPAHAATMRRDLGYWHCGATSTNWKSDRTGRRPADIAPAPELRRDLDEAGLRAS